MIQLIQSLARKRDFVVIGSTRYKLLRLDLKDQVTYQLVYPEEFYNFSALSVCL